MKKFLFGILGLLFAVPAVAATLPAGYTELEYIESTGTQWINPSVSYTENDSLRLVMDMQYTDTNLSSAQLSGIFASAYMGIAAGNVGAAGTWSVAGGATNANADTLRHTFDMSATIDSDQIVTLKIDNNTYTHTRNVGSGNLGILNLVSGSGNFYSKAKLYSTKVYKNVTLVRDMIPAKNSSNVIGMYDLVSGQFFTNAGTGTFTAGPVVDSCRNLLQPNACTDGYYYTETGEYTDAAPARLTDFIPVVAGQPYTIKLMKSGSTNLNLRVNFFDSNKTWLSQSVFAIGNAGTFVYNTVTPQQNGYIRISANRDIGSQNGVFVDYNTYMIVHGEYNASNYPEYCVPESSSSSSPIKIATTAYNSARFSPVVTELNDTIATIRSVVTNTINQTKAIADLQATKQTRPDENCPAGKKCLLVEDDAGQPHWYEIIESPEVQ